MFKKLIETYKASKIEKQKQIDAYNEAVRSKAIINISVFIDGIEYEKIEEITGFGFGVDYEYFYTAKQMAEKYFETFCLKVSEKGYTKNYVHYPPHKIDRIILNSIVEL